jgi:hypothetical protein
MKIDSKKSWIIIISIVFLISLFIFFRPPEPVKIQSVSVSQPAEDVLAGATNIKRFSDINRNVASNVAVSATNKRTNTNPAITRTPIPPPYPRITINFSSQAVSSIRGNDAGNDARNYSFIITTLEIQNYGYKYFDASASKFRSGIGNTEIRPLINISTGNMIDAVIPSNSSAQGDLVFLVSKRGAGIGMIRYISGGYTILYHRGLSSESTSSTNPECANDPDNC